MKHFFILAILFAQSAWSVGVGVYGSFGQTSGTLEQIAPGFEKYNPNYFHIGLQTELPVTAFFSVQPEISYGRRGFGTVFKQGFTENQKYLFMSSLYLPLLAKIKINPFDATRFYVYAGPELSIKLSEGITSSVINGVNGTSETVDFVSKEPSILFNPYHLSAVAGGGMEVDISPSLGIFLDARYTLGITNALARPLGSQASARLSSFQGLLGAKLFF